MVDARIEYTWVWKLYTGKEDDGVEHGLLHKAMMELVNDPRREKKGYIVIMGICYPIPAFVRDLPQHGFAVCGTACRDRKGIPKSMPATKLKKGKVRSKQVDGVMALKWHDKHVALTLSTYLDSSMVEKLRHLRAAVGGVDIIQKPHVLDRSC